MTEKKKRTRSQAGKLSRASGAKFERKIAQFLRDIYDPPALKAELAAADRKTRPGILKRSIVQRGDQRGGAKAPDVAIPDHFWLELQWRGEGGRMDCSDKLEQAEADIAALTDPRTPAVVWARKGSPAVYVTMRIGDLHMAVSGLGFADDTTLDVAIIHWWTFEKILRRNWRRKQ